MTTATEPRPSRRAARPRKADGRGGDEPGGAGAPLIATSRSRKLQSLDQLAPVERVGNADRGGGRLNPAAKIDAIGAQPCQFAVAEEETA